MAIADQSNKSTLEMHIQTVEADSSLYPYNLTPTKSPNSIVFVAEEYRIRGNGISRTHLLSDGWLLQPRNHYLECYDQGLCL